MKPSPKIQIYTGGVHRDERGCIYFVNNFRFKNVKRYYLIENEEKEPIRAFHGHKKEGKYFYVISGSYLLCAVYIDDFKNPSKNQKIFQKVLTAENPEIVALPPGFANGFKMLEKNSKIMIYSTSTVKQSEKDSYRYSFDYWGKEIWETYL